MDVESEDKMCWIASGKWNVTRVTFQESRGPGVSPRFHLSFSGLIKWMRRQGGFKISLRDPGVWRFSLNLPQTVKICEEYAIEMVCVCVCVCKCVCMMRGLLDHWGMEFATASWYKGKCYGLITWGWRKQWEILLVLILLVVIWLVLTRAEIEEISY